MVITACVTEQGDDGDQSRNTAVFGPGATEAKPGEFPSVGVLSLLRGHALSKCTASLIAPDAVLTAAHCVIQDTDAPLPYELVQELIFAVNGSIYPAAAATFHPQFVTSVSRYLTGADADTRRLIRNRVDCEEANRDECNCWDCANDNPSALDSFGYSLGCSLCLAHRCADEIEACKQQVGNGASKTCRGYFDGRGTSPLGGREFDIAVVKLWKSVSGISPSKLGQAPVTAGQRVVLAGYGLPSSGELWKAVQTVFDVEANQFSMASDTYATPGDSGGPTFSEETGDQVGVHSGGGGGENGMLCRDRHPSDRHIRVDAFHSWIMNLAKAPVPCGARKQGVCRPTADCRTMGRDPIALTPSELESSGCQAGAQDSVVCCSR